MRGRREPQVSMLTFIDLETRVPADHPLRTINRLADRALAQLSPEFDRMYVRWYPKTRQLAKRESSS